MKGKNIPKKYAILVEASAFEGVKRIAAKVALDIEKVTGILPPVITEEEFLAGKFEQVILCATVGQSAMLDELEESGHLNLYKVRGKREVFQLQFVESKPEGVGELLVIAGSDKRGTIYGMFTLSEYFGVTSLTYFGDAPVLKRDVVIGKDVEQTSKEPSVKYRGFFINDEWPCCGTWATKHFGWFNADMYEHIFEFLLRMKGNYLWPAMWSASFPIDGPEGKNEELADMYGVVMGYSHHEPCLRASEEWDKVRGPETKYGNEWNFYTNEEGLMNYWAEALERSGKFDNLITIGMRGERDTSMLGENATVEENVNLLKDIITKQRQLIKKHVNSDINKVPQLLALYKEVEAYFYGNENIAGLKDWKELDGVICMLCEDNFGHMRTLPTEDVRNRKGGWGMYYHFDYHGGPISYEWVDSTPLTKTWEQMCMAYEYGIKDAWIVNVGDVKFHEVPLTYFLSLAYDYDKWGYSNKNSAKEYMEQWAKANFASVDEETRAKIVEVFDSYININHKRRPESSNSHVYHPCHYNESSRMIAEAKRVERLSEEVMESLNEEERAGYYSMIHFSAMASANLLKMHLYAGKNELYARQGKVAANAYAVKVRECIRKDKEYANQFAAFKDGKWDGMQLAQHIGFTKWNEDDCRYPIIHSVEPVYKPRLVVSKGDEEATATKTYGPPMTLKITDFVYAGCERAIVEVANQGIGKVAYRIFREDGKELPAWLSISPMEGEVELVQKIVFTCDRSKLPVAGEKVRLLISDNDTVVAVEVYGKAVNTEGLPEMTFLNKHGVTVIEANHFAWKKDTEKGSFEVIENYGKYGTGVKVFPSTAVFAKKEEKPFVAYRFIAEEAGEYQIDLVVAPINSVVNKKKVSVVVENGLGDVKEAVIVPEDFRAGESGDIRWAQGVLNQARTVSVTMLFNKGVQDVKVGAMEAGTVLERIYIHKPQVGVKPSYLGPEETLCPNMRE